MRKMEWDRERDEAFLTSGEAARRLHIGKKTLLRAVGRGDLVPAHRTPRGYARFHAADIRAYAARLSAAWAVSPSPQAASDASTVGAPSRPVGAALLRLATLALDDAPDVDGAIAAILALLADSLDVGVTFLSRVGGTTLHVERAHDRAGMGLASGTAVPLCDTY
jgi:excisionase family DNA binding protein